MDVTRETEVDDDRDTVVLSTAAAAAAPAPAPAPEPQVASRLVRHHNNSALGMLQDASASHVRRSSNTTLHAASSNDRDTELYVLSTAAAAAALEPQAASARAPLVSLPNSNALGMLQDVSDKFDLSTAASDPATLRDRVRVTIVWTRYGRKFTFDLELWTFVTVRSIKEAIRAKQGIPVEVQRLSLIGGEDLKDDDAFASHYGVLHGSWLLLDTAVHIVVDAVPLSCHIAVDADSLDRVAHFKQLLQQSSNGMLPAGPSISRGEVGDRTGPPKN